MACFGLLNYTGERTWKVHRVFQLELISSSSKPNVHRLFLVSSNRKIIFMPWGAFRHKTRNNESAGCMWKWFPYLILSHSLSLLLVKLEHHELSMNVTRVKADWMANLKVAFGSCFYLCYICSSFLYLVYSLLSTHWYLNGTLIQSISFKSSAHTPTHKNGLCLIRQNEKWMSEWESELELVNWKWLKLVWKRKSENNVKTINLDNVTYIYYFDRCSKSRIFATNFTSFI